MSDTGTNYYPPNTYVCVTAPEDRSDPFMGWVGIVDETHNDGGDMVHFVKFPDGNSSYYYADEISHVRSARAAARLAHPCQLDRRS